MIGIKSESHDLYQLRTFAYVSLMKDFPSLIHTLLNHPNFAKLQHLVPCLSKLSTLCESCQLEKHSCSYFPKSISSRALSSFTLIHSIIWSSRNC